jgi:integrase
VPCGWRARYREPLERTAASVERYQPIAGVPVHVVAARLVHADPSITLRVYAHVVNEQLAEAADIFARSIPESDAAVSKSVSKKTPPEPGRGL